MTRRWLLITTIAALTVALAFVVVQLVRGQDSGKEQTEANPGKAKPAASSPTDEKKNSDGPVPAGYLGTWSGSVDNPSGHSTRELVIKQGTVGQSVLTLTADGPLDNGASYHCVFEAGLASEPTPNGPIQIAPSTVTVGEPMSSCTAGKATTLTLLPNGTLSRETPETGEKLTYTKTN
ncbi:hypothetical protein [Streptomyces sp. Ncost-T10-10d]|uniref:hypothetical protein n=1 Tax=Streptomyces sp. Ncost-T10-10d TaxID=1839774 RepID=UPI00114CF063|nr:hypothetical protein [Streptomyces sp. Ncost-T10-10d]